MPEHPSDLLDRLPAAPRALLLALAESDKPTRARDLADAAHVSRFSAAQRLEALARLDLVVYRDGPGPNVADRVRVYELAESGRRLLADRNASVGSGPTVHTRVLADRVRPASQRAHEEIARALARADDHLQGWFASELTRIYIAGVSDGFAQGVAAEAAAHPTGERAAA